MYSMYMYVYVCMYVKFHKALNSVHSEVYLSLILPNLLMVLRVIFRSVSAIIVYVCWCLYITYSIFKCFFSVDNKANEMAPYFL